jgi:hypothetical protein
VIDLTSQAFSFLDEGRLPGSTAGPVPEEEEADYNPVFDFAAEDVPALRREVDALAARIRALIAEAGGIC